MGLKNLPKQQRPRERLLELGEDALSSIELLAIILGNGTKGHSVLELAEELIIQFGSLTVLSKASIQELLSVKGVGKAKAIQLKAAFSLARKIQKEEVPDRILLNASQSVFRLIAKEMKHPTEMLMVICRDKKGYHIHREIISMGILDEVLLHPREVFHFAIKQRAASIILAHNHPSGDPTPSHADIYITKTMSSAGNMIGIPLVDHLIMGNQCYISMQEKHFLNTRY